MTIHKDNEFVLAEGSVVIIDSNNNRVTTEKAEYDKSIDRVTTYQNTKIFLKNGYEITSGQVVYDNKNKLIISNDKSTIIDLDGNLISVDMFEYIIEKSLFSSRGNIKIVDMIKNKYFFEEIYIDTKNKKIVGSDVSVSMNQASVGLDKENDPRFVANTAYISKENSDFSNAVFTT